ncbi:hypothetical protein F3Y22_tig00111582pilonHSYRG00755 [Hibiscus syriacus]|uniref:Uncharacterized protein n=1 Tax=Hibiscus syriacus TaxID=106335 RepID=A0A6A2Y638_HIBSY|nr:hypothetical protein F3Y22_tig00111582pilonHSYRG00755 [Hibiscus syriacus]
MSHSNNLKLSPACFESMPNLRYTKFDVPEFLSSWAKRSLTNGDIDIDYLPNELKYLQWENYPFKSLSLSFNPKNLVVLKLSGANMEQLWNEDFQLRKIPNLLRAINLESLDCIDLVVAGTSIHVVGPDDDDVEDLEEDIFIQGIWLSFAHWWNVAWGDLCSVEELFSTWLGRNEKIFHDKRLWEIDELLKGFISVNYISVAVSGSSLVGRLAIEGLDRCDLFKAWW